MALKFLTILQSLYLVTTSHRKGCKSNKYDRKLTEIDDMTKRVRYRVNGAFVPLCKFQIIIFHFLKN